MSKVKSWQITAQVRDKNNTESTVTTFVRADSKKDAEKAGLRSILHMPDICSVGPVTAEAWTNLSSINPEVS